MLLEESCQLKQAQREVQRCIRIRSPSRPHNYRLNRNSRPLSNAEQALGVCPTCIANDGQPSPLTSPLLLHLSPSQPPAPPPPQPSPLLPPQTAVAVTAADGSTATAFVAAAATHALTHERFFTQSHWLPTNALVASTHVRF